MQQGGGRNLLFLTYLVLPNLSSFFFYFYFYFLGPVTVQLITCGLLLGGGTQEETKKT